MKYLIYFFIVIALAGCKEEEAALRFTQIPNSNPAGIKIDYFSPDPLHCAKSYEIRANSQGAYSNCNAPTSPILRSWKASLQEAHTQILKANTA